MIRSIKDDMRGVAHVVMILAVVAVVGVAAFAGMRVMKKDKQSNNGSSAELAKLISEAKCEYDDKDLCKFFVSWKEHKQYRMSSTSTGEGAGTMVMEVDGDKNRMAT